MLRNLWNKITNPIPSVTNAEQKHQVQLLQSLLFIIIFLGSSSALIQLIIVPGFLKSFIPIVLAITALIGAFIITRRGNYKLGTVITCTITTLACYANILINPGDIIVYFYILLPVILVNLLLPMRVAIGFIFSILAGIIALVVYNQGGIPDIFQSMLLFSLSLIMILITVTTSHRNKIEDIRQYQLLNSTEKLKKIHDLHNEYIFRVADGLRNPLQIFVGNLELLNISNFTPEQLEIFEAIKISGKKLEENIIFLADRMGIEKAEKDLVEMEKKFRAISEDSPSMIFIHKNGKIIYWNKKCEELLGYGHKEFLTPGFSFFSLVAPDSLSAVRAKIEKQEINEMVEPFRTTLITKSKLRLEGLHQTSLVMYNGERSIQSVLMDISKSNLDNSNAIQ